MFKNFLKGLKDVCDDLMDSNVGEELKKAGRELKAQLLQEESTGSTQTTSGDSSASTINTTTATGSQPTNTETSATLEIADAECALTVPAEDGPRGEFSGLDEKTYSYLIPKDEGFIDEGNCHAAEIHQAYGFGREINYERDVMFVFSIAGEFDCEIKESRAKAAYTRYDSAPTRSKLMTVEHPVFTHAYLFDTPKKYRITYLKKLGEYELLGCELILRKSGGDEAWKAKMIEEFKRFAGSCREV
ncbi:MAG: hypothetical protein IKT67_12465 [Lachnospiraceae bacterium]|nr:hypothetical protein [Lachnospiraceae bacterium]